MICVRPRLSSFKSLPVTFHISQNILQKVFLLNWILMLQMPNQTLNNLWGTCENSITRGSAVDSNRFGCNLLYLIHHSYFDRLRHTGIYFYLFEFDWLHWKDFITFRVRPTSTILNGIKFRFDPCRLLTNKNEHVWSYL